MDKIKGL